MADLEKAIRGLECCSTYDDYSRKSCRECPYNEPDGKRSCKLHQMRVDAITLLKAQKPRVMTLEEVLSFDSAIYMDEAQNTVCLKMLYCYEVGRETYDHGYTFVDSDGDRIYYPAKGFNKTWRCWTSRPTDEQRAATPWSEPPKEES